MREEALLLEHKKTTQYHDMDDHNAAAVMENMQFFFVRKSRENPFMRIILEATKDA